VLNLRCGPGVVVVPAVVMRLFVESVKNPCCVKKKEKNCVISLMMLMLMLLLLLLMMMMNVVGIESDKYAHAP